MVACLTAPAGCVSQVVRCVSAHCALKQLLRQRYAYGFVLQLAVVVLPNEVSLATGKVTQVAASTLSAMDGCVSLLIRGLTMPVA